MIGRTLISLVAVAFAGFMGLVLVGLWDRRSQDTATEGLGETIERGYPSRPINVVVPFPAGGPSDVVARVVTEQMGNNEARPCQLVDALDKSLTIPAKANRRAWVDQVPPRATYTAKFGRWLKGICMLGPLIPKPHQPGITTNRARSHRQRAWRLPVN